MLFTSIEFILFLLPTLLLFYLLPARGQRVLLLAANYIFYMWWEPIFGIFLLFGTVVTYLTAIAAQKRLFDCARFWVGAGVVYILGQLVVFKYADFFLSGIFAVLGLGAGPTLGLLLPIGISFYSFAAAGYIFDVYRGKLEAERNFLDYASFISFFPTILSGPISRARELLPQFKYRHLPDGAQMRKGLLRFVWGAAKKLVAADYLLVAINTAYASPESFTGGQWLFVVILYSLYIYLDFSSYSDMAIGTAWMLGFRIPENFDVPYCAQTVRDFWRRWHISLTSWFREYLFFPLGGSRVRTRRVYLNILIVFLVSGLWHGAAVTFIIWGGLNGIYQIVGQLTDPLRAGMRRRLRIREHSRLLAAVRVTFIFALITLTWIFFRAESTGQAVFIIKRIFLILRDGFGAQPLTQLGLSARTLLMLPFFLAPFIAEDVMRAKGRTFPNLENRPYVYCLIMLVLLVAIAVFGAYGEAFDQSEFVYFKF